MNWHWWFVAILGFLALEVLLPKRFWFASLAGGAVAACLAGGQGAGTGWTWGLFAGVSVLLLLIAARLARRQDH